LAYSWLSDLVVAIHLAYAGFVVVGWFLAGRLGSFSSWTWITNLKFQIYHLLGTALVAVGTLCGITCPLIALENLLLEQGGRTGHQRSFIWAMDERPSVL